MLGIKPSQPEVFPNLQFVGALDPDLPENAQPELLAAGFNSSAWKIGSKVVKATKQELDISAAKRLLDTMKFEDGMLQRHIDDYMPETQYTLALARDPEDGRVTNAHVVTLQPFVEASSLPDFLAQPERDTEPLREFLAKSKEVFKVEGFMPDIACVEDRFDVLKNSNVLIREDKEAAPVLVDTTFGKTQRSASLGRLWTRLIYTGAFIADKRLESSQNNSVSV